MKVSLIQSPRRYWPFLSEGDNYILPQWMPYIASAIRKAGYAVQCFDCVAEKVGWKTIEGIIRKDKPQVVGISESHALYIDESIKLVKLIKNIDKKIIVICGGGHFSNYAEETLRENPQIDFIVRGEGEITIIKLLEALENGKNFQQVNGIAFLKEGEYLQTEPRALIEDLDTLPSPAYDLMPMEMYGKSKYLFSPGGITIHHSRGCPNNCRFCVWWTQMAERRIMDGREMLYPRWRTKSVTETIREIESLINRYNKRCFIFVDGSWNIDPNWNLQFAEEIIKNNIKINWFAFMRVDCILRDEELGIMEKLVESGLSHICLGAEHCCETIMADFDKKNQNKDDTKICVDILRKKYPEVFIQATFIVGTKNESRETMALLAKYIKKLKVDYPAVHAFTPVPGTDMYEEAKSKGWLEVTDFSHYDWNTPIISTNYLTREEMEWEIYKLYRNSLSLTWILKGLFSKSAYKRNMYIWWLIIILRLIISGITDKIHPKKYIKGLIEPEWYNK